MIPQWKHLLYNLAWYIGTVVVLLFVMRFLRFLPLIALLWMVALVWGAFLAHKGYQLFLDQRTSEIASEHLERYILQAHGHQAEFKRFIEQSNPHTQAELAPLARQIDAWVKLIERLIVRIDQLSQNTMLQHNVKTVPETIAELENRLSLEKDPSARAKINRALSHRRKQWQALKSLQTHFQEAEQKIEASLSLFQRLCTHLLTDQSAYQTQLAGSFSSRIRNEMRRLTASLNELRTIL